MRIIYISSSLIPSRQANTIHVLNQVNAFAKLGFKVELFIASSQLNNNILLLDIKKSFNLFNKNIIFHNTYTKFRRGNAFFIALKSSLYSFKLNTRNNLIISRNIYAAFILGFVFRKKIIYETHTLERGLRGIMQKILLNNNLVETVVITNYLRKYLIRHHKTEIKKVSILPDAATAGLKRFKKKKKLKYLKGFLNEDYKKYDLICGYFGHLYTGRGIDVICELSKRNPNFMFLIYGGSEEDIKKTKRRYQNNNLFLKGFIEHNQSLIAMRCMDVLLMPYKEIVSVALKGFNTAKWMSPLKMFEYMSAGVPIIASDLPALKEVLEHNFNCLLAPPDNYQKWNKALNIIYKNKSLAKFISKNSFDGYVKKYNWEKRATDFIGIYKKNIS